MDEESVSAPVPVAADGGIITTVPGSSNGRLYTVGREGVSWASGDDDVRQHQKPFRAMPGVDVRIRVDADDEEDLATRVTASNLAQCVDGVGGTGATNLEIRRLQERAVPCGEL
jgi:hypothetical protein